MLKLGIIGFSEGNGHPYSWSAIFNGVDKYLIHGCGFPVIAEYLGKRILPEEAIKGAKVTHVWTQDIKLSEKIAQTTYIENICSTIESLAVNVDAILLARDDWQSHLELGLPLLKYGKPIYIDKPIAVDSSSLNKLLGAQSYEGQIFSCSALRYSSQLRLTGVEKQALGEVRYINCVIPKSWEKYSIHLIDPVVALFAEVDDIKSIKHRRQASIEESQVTWRSGLITNFATLGNLPAKIQFDLIGESSSRTINWDDAFSTFKSALEVFVHQVITNNPKPENEHHRKVVQIIEEGMK